MTPRVFSKQELAKHMEGMVPLRTIQFYTDEGLIVPYHNPKGRGARRLYSAKNAVEFYLIGMFGANGITLNKAKQYMDYARSKKIDAKWDPDGEWCKKSGHEHPVLVLVNMSEDNVKMHLVNVDEVINIINHKSVLTSLIINVGYLFTDVNSW